MVWNVGVDHLNYLACCLMLIIVVLLSAKVHVTNTLAYVCNQALTALALLAILSNGYTNDVHHNTSVKNIRFFYLQINI